MKLKRYLCVSLAILLLISMLAACSAAAPMEKDYAAAETMAPMATTGAYYAADSANGSGAPSLESGSKNPESNIPANQKLIRTITLDAETEDMDALLEAVFQRVNELEGYVEDRNIYNGSSYNGKYIRRYANLTIRIPAKLLDQFVAHVSDVSNITSNRETTEDVTLSYVATESRIIALETEQTRLLELLAKAGDMSDLLLIEARLTEVRAELEQMQSQLRLYDNLVSYGTIHLDITEVREYTPVEEEPETVWQRISVGFVKSVKGLWKGITEIFVFLIVALPYLAVIALAVTLLVLAIRAGKRKKKKITQMPTEDKEN